MKNKVRLQSLRAQISSLNERTSIYQIVDLDFYNVMKSKKKNMCF